MANMIRTVIKWTGFTGAPGYTNLFWESTAGAPIDQATVNAAVSKVDTWIATFRPSLPQLCVTQVDAQVAEIDENTGQIRAFWTGSPAAAAGGSSTGAYAAGSGACITWITNDVADGRRIRGRTFIVPLGSAGYAADGSLDDAKLTTWRTATATFIDDSAAARLVVWKRPSEIIGEPFINGGAYDVTAFNITDKPAQLRSRRD